MSSCFLEVGLLESDALGLDVESLGPLRLRRILVFLVLLKLVHEWQDSLRERTRGRSETRWSHEETIAGSDSRISEHGSERSGHAEVEAVIVLGVAGADAVASVSQGGAVASLPDEIHGQVRVRCPADVA